MSSWEHFANSYYWIIDLELISKTVDGVPFIFNVDTLEWELDDKFILLDRIYGYEEGEGIGNTDMLDRVKHVKENQAIEYIDSLIEVKKIIRELYGKV